MEPRVLFWRRIDAEGFERLDLSGEGDLIQARGTVLCVDAGGFRIDHAWTLGPDWRARAVTVERWGPGAHECLALERDGDGWRVNGEGRPDLDGAEEPDLSVTPFCNSLPIHRLGGGPGATLTLDTAYVDGPALTVVRSSQRYERIGPRAVRYVDLGVANGFEAELTLDEDGTVVVYEHLFQRVETA